MIICMQINVNLMLLESHLHTEFTLQFSCHNQLVEARQLKWLPSVSLSSKHIHNKSITRTIHL